MKGKWRLLLDQNIRFEILSALREHSFDVVHASEVGLQRALDPELLGYAIENGRALITRDSDFGDLNIFPLPLEHPGVIRIRIAPPLPATIVRSLLSLLNTHTPPDIQNALVILSSTKIRIRRASMQ